MHGGSKCESHYAHACTRSMEGLLFVLALDYIAMGLYEFYIQVCRPREHV